jgi:Putative Ig domain
VSFTADGMSGTPAAGTAGQYDVQVTLSNGVAPADVQAEVLTVGVPPVLGSAASRATFRTGEAGRVTFSATGYPQPAFSVAGTLPAGVRMSQSGVLSGTPGAREGGRYPLTIRASKVVGSAQAGFELVVDEPVSFSSARHVTFAAGVRARFAIVTRGYPAAHLRESGRLPAGLAFRASANGTATLSGEAAHRDKGHTYKIVITAGNGVGRAVRQVIDIRVR